MRCACTAATSCRSIPTRTGPSTIVNGSNCGIASSCVARAGSNSWSPWTPPTRTPTSASCATCSERATAPACSVSSTCSPGCSDEELGVGPSAEAWAVRDLALGPLKAPATSRRRRRCQPRSASLATQRVHFCTTTDGVQLAYATSGNGPPLVKASNWLTHLDYDWDSPVWRHWWQALSRTAHVDPVRRTWLRVVRLGCRRRLLHARSLGPRPRDRRRRARPRAVPPPRHLAGRPDRDHLRGSSSGTSEPRGRVRHVRQSHLGQGERRASAGSSRRWAS